MNFNQLQIPLSGIPLSLKKTSSLFFLMILFLLNFNQTQANNESSTNCSIVLNTNNIQCHNNGTYSFTINVSGVDGSWNGTIGGQNYYGNGNGDKVVGPFSYNSGSTISGWITQDNDPNCFADIVYTPNCQNNNNNNTCDGQITGFQINHSGNLSNVNNGMATCSSDYSQDIRIRANVSGSHQSLKFNITGPGVSVNNTENQVTYDSNQFWTNPGTYTINAKLYSEDGANGTLCDERTMTFIVEDCSAPTPDCTGEITGFKIVHSGNAANVPNNNTVCNTDYSQDIRIRATVSGSHQSVRFHVSGPGVNETNTDNGTAYQSNNFWTNPGTYTINAKLYSEDGANGMLCDERTLTLVVNDCSAPTPTCDIAVNTSNLQCHNNGTYSFTINVSGSNGSWNGTIGGQNYYGNGNGSKVVGPFPYNNGSNVSGWISEDGNSNCFVDIVYTPNCQNNTTCDGQITGFQINHNGMLSNVNNGMSFCGSDFYQDIRIRANVSGSHQSLIFNITGPGVNVNNTENLVTYDSHQFWVNPGTYTINAKLYSQDGGNGNLCDERTVTFVVEDCAVPPPTCDGQITGFKIVHNGNVSNVPNNNTVCNTDYSQDIRIRATVSGSHQSVQFHVSGPGVNENNTDNGTAYQSNNFWTNPGTYNITAKLYSQDGANGILCDEKTLTLVVTDCSTPPPPPPATCDGQITGFQINHAGMLNNVNNGMSFCGSDFYQDIRIRANVSGSHQSLKFNITGPNVNISNVENLLTYDSQQFWTNPGTYNINAKLYSQDGATGNVCDEKTITFVVEDCAAPPPTCTGQITGFKIVHSGNAADVPNNNTVCNTDYSQDIRIRATVSGSHQSVRFHVSGPGTNETNTDNTTNYQSKNFWTDPGTYTITAKLYSEDGANGTLCDEKTLTLVVNDCQSSCGSITDFKIFHDGNVMNIPSNNTVCESDFSKDIRIRAIAEGNHQSLRFHISGPGVNVSNIENLVTYDSKYFWANPGTYTINAKLYSDDGANGTLCDEETITLIVSGNCSNMSYGGTNVRSRVYLQGAEDQTSSGTMLMRDNLRQDGIVPTYEPYGLLGFDHVGAETTTMAVLSQQGQDAIVDWVLIEVRDPNNPSQVLATRSALVQRDGDVVDVDGTSSVFFEDLESGNYHIAIRHRNHLGVMTAQTVSLSESNSQIVDFTSPQTATYGTHAQTQMGGNMALWAGNSDMNNSIIFQGNNNDNAGPFFEILTAEENPETQINYILAGYYQGDVTMDCFTVYQGNNNDLNRIFFNTVAHPANVNYLSNFVIMQQLP